MSVTVELCQKTDLRCQSLGKGESKERDDRHKQNYYQYIIFHYDLIYCQSNMNIIFTRKKHDAWDCCAFSRWIEPTPFLVYMFNWMQGDLWLFDGFQGGGRLCTLHKVCDAWNLHCLRIIDSKKSPTTGINNTNEDVKRLKS